MTDPRPPYGPLDAPWDPTEELAFLLQDAMASEQAAGQPPAPPAEPHEAAPDHGSLAGLTRITATLPPIKPAGPGHRKSRSRSLTWPQTASLTLAALAAAIVSMVSVFGGMVTYAPLRHVAEARTHSAVVGWWPLLVYGPWLVASLSVLRAALHQRRAVHSWSVVLLFSTMAILLCVAQAPRTFTDVAAAALPALAALACFQQLVRQITLTRPPRQAAPRHRSTSPPPTGAGRPRPPKPPAAVPGQSRGTGGAGGPER
ncbi:DUF2637 domain-containing protein [Streptomyces ficellus]|uniref:DUF2637 domain-containing protein n=1 Tax=Streptomyces ficellus TaxID=1977088 RepID=A0ABT7ZBY9_9ACTN|nr:DUF2637 domain-containing protein [Streptomyces ficellus]MDN3297017.1 DUF2637 domain-containing protein [Streptomyces ficellus]